MLSDFFTVQNLVIAFSLAGSVYAVLKAVAPRTRTTADDKALECIDKARKWIHDFSAPAWTIVEQLAKSGKIGKLNKYAEYISILKEAYQKAFGEELPSSVEVDAKLIADGLSASEKLARANPTAGQGAQ